MNIDGNKVIWEKGNIAVAETGIGCIVCKRLTVKNADGTAFRQWVNIEAFEDSESAIAYAEKQKL